MLRWRDLLSIGIGSAHAAIWTVWILPFNMVGKWSLMIIIIILKWIIGCHDTREARRAAWKIPQLRYFFFVIIFIAQLMVVSVFSSCWDIKVFMKALLVVWNKYEVGRQQHQLQIIKIVCGNVYTFLTNGFTTYIFL